MNLHPKTTEAYRLLHDGVLAMARAERQGIRVDLGYLTKEKARISKQIVAEEVLFKGTKFYKDWNASTKSDINFNSSVQLSKFLYKVKKLKPPKLTDNGQGSTDEEALGMLRIPDLDHLIKYKKLKKTRDTYLASLSREQVNGYIHPFFNLHLVKTFRSSSSSPNFQNLPKHDKDAMKSVRSALYPRPGHLLLEVDFKGLEVSISVCYHKDEKMLTYVRNPDTDMHRDMMEEIFKIKFDGSPEHNYLRNATKNGFVFPQFYGDYYVHNAKDIACKWGELPNGIWKPGQGVSLDGANLSDHMLDIGFKSIRSFETHLKKIEKDFWENRFPDYARWKRRWWTLYSKKGCLDMFTGFRCSGVMGRNDATNYPIQGAAFHCLLWCFIKLDTIMRAEKWDTRLIGQIHDAIIFDVHPDELEKVSKIIHMVTTEHLPQAWDWINVPLRVDAEICPVDGSWAEKEHYNLIN